MVSTCVVSQPGAVGVGKMVNREAELVVQLNSGSCSATLTHIYDIMTTLISCLEHRLLSKGVCVRSARVALREHVYLASGFRSSRVGPGESLERLF